MSKSLLARIGTRRFVQHGFVWLLATMVGACTSLDAGTEDLKDPETIERIKTDGPEGIFVLYDGTGPEGPCGDRAGQFAYWRFLDEEDIYIYHRALFSPMDVGSALLDLERELGVDVEAIAKTHASFRRALTLAERASGTHGTVPDMANDDEPRWDLLTENRLRKVARLPHGRGEVSPMVGAHPRLYLPPLEDDDGSCGPAAKAIVLPPPEKPCRDAFRTDPVGTAVAVVKRCGGCTGECGRRCPRRPCQRLTGCYCGKCYYAITHPCPTSSGCWIAWCSDQQGCIFESVCNVGFDACGGTRCEYGGQCITWVTDCDDDNACTSDSCDPVWGCQNEWQCTAPSDACTERGCDPDTGCFQRPVDCDDNNPCTTDSCNPASGCINEWFCTEPSDACTQRGCDDGSCFEEPRDCDDDDPCTIDSCVLPTGCRYDPKCPDDDGNPCVVITCLDGQCVENSACYDGNPCTTDRCIIVDADNGTYTCEFIVRGDGTPCPDGNPCTSDYCMEGTCWHNPMTGPACPEDGDICTDDLCVDGTCTHPPGNNGATCADDGDVCTNDICASGVCTHPDKCPGQICCSNGECCDHACDLCLDDGPLSPGSITADPNPVCVGDSITFTLSGVTDPGGLKEVDCSGKEPIPPGTITYAWEITKPDGSTVSDSGPSATVLGDQPGTYSATVTATTARECPPPPLTIGPANASVIGLTSQTEATTPADRARTTLGIGEIVTISTNPATTVDWSRTGGGSIDPDEGTDTTLTASMSASTSTIIGTFPGGATCDIAFTVIAPTGLTCTVGSEIGCGAPGPPNNMIGSETLFECTVQPTTVSFFWAQFRENIPGEAWTWPDGTADIWPATVVPWDVNQANEVDDEVAMCGDPIGQLDPPPPGGGYVSFSLDVRVPEEYLNEAGTWVQWFPETHTREFRGADAATRGIINASNTAAGVWQGPWQ